MLSRLMTKVLPFDGEHVYYDGEKMTPEEAANCIYVAFAFVAITVVPLLLLLHGR